MALTLDASARIPATADTVSTSNPVTGSFTCPAGTEALVLMVHVAGNADRTGGAPTYNGVSLTQRDETRGNSTGYEAGLEAWDLLDPPTGSSYTISVPNGTGVGIWIHVVAIDGGGDEVDFDAAAGEEAGGTGTDRTVSITTGADGCFIVAGLSTGDNNWSPTGWTGTSIDESDCGSYGGGCQYYVKATAGAQDMAWTGDTTGDDVAMIAVSYKPVSSGVTGTANITLAAFTSTAAGTVDVAGALNKTLDGFTSSAAGTVDITGALSQTLADMTLTAAGSVGGTIEGAADITLAAFTSTAAGTVDVAGALDKTLDAFTSSAAGTVDVAGAANITLAAFTSTAAGTVDVAGAADITLAAFTSTAAGTVDIAGAADITLANVTLSATGNATGGISGAANITLAAFTSTAAGTVDIAGTFDQTLAPVTSSSAGAVEVSGAADITLAAFTSTATAQVYIAGAASINLDAFTLSAAGTSGGAISGELSVTLDPFTLAAAGISAHAGGSMSAIAVGRRPLEPALQSYKYRRLR